MTSNCSIPLGPPSRRSCPNELEVINIAFWFLVCRPNMHTLFLPTSNRHLKEARGIIGWIFQRISSYLPNFFLIRRLRLRQGVPATTIPPFTTISPYSSSRSHLNYLNTNTPFTAHLPSRTSSLGRVIDMPLIPRLCGENWLMAGQHGSDENTSRSCYLSLPWEDDTAQYISHLEMTVLVGNLIRNPRDTLELNPQAVHDIAQYRFEPRVRQLGSHSASHVHTSRLF
jgi:hypothetical protein